MNYRELVDQVSLNIFWESEKIDSRNSYLVIRNSLEKLDIDNSKQFIEEIIF